MDASTATTPRPGVLRFALPPAPPHDPYALLLAGWIGATPAAGWRTRDLQDAEFAAASHALVLAPAPDAERRAAEPSGSLGGLRPPINVAIGPDGDVYLLDTIAGTLLRYDDCACEFRTLPCTTRAAPLPGPDTGRPAGRARGPVAHGRVLDAQAIASCGRELFVADAGHARVLRFALPGLLPHGAWTLPAAQRAGMATAWAPDSMAFDGRGRLHVADAHHQRIDRFDAAGHWQCAWSLPLPVWHLAVDEAGHLFAVLCDADGLAVQGGAGGVSAWAWVGQRRPPQLVRLDADPSVPPVIVTPHSDQLPGFAGPPFAVDARGFVHLGCRDACVPCRPFDARGRAVGAGRTTPAPLYRRAGRFQSTALDSAIDGCTWHRVELRGCLPEGCSVALRTLTTEIVLDDAELALLPDTDWSEAVVATAMDAGQRWDALVRSAPGRYLWLRLELAGDGSATPELCAVLVETPRISLRRFLPGVFGADPAGADFTDRFTAIFDATLRSIEGRLDGQAALFDPLSTPAERHGAHQDFLGWLASWVGVALERDWPVERRRRYLRSAATLWARRGTPEGLRAQLIALLGLDAAAACCAAERPRSRCVARPLNCGIGPELLPAAAPALLLEHFKLRRWLFAGRGRLGDDSVLWGQRIVDRSQLGAAASAAPTSCGVATTAGAPSLTGSARLGASQLVSTPDPYTDPLRVHASRISLFVPACVRDRPADDRALRALLAAELPAHVAAEVHYVEPRMRVGVQAMVGLDTVIARTPMGVRLADAPGAASRAGLARATVLPDQPPAGWQVGLARVGRPRGIG